MYIGNIHILHGPQDPGPQWPKAQGPARAHARCVYFLGTCIDYILLFIVMCTKSFEQVVQIVDNSRQIVQILSLSILSLSMICPLFMKHGIRTTEQITSHD